MQFKILTGRPGPPWATPLDFTCTNLCKLFKQQIFRARRNPLMRTGLLLINFYPWYDATREKLWGDDSLKTNSCAIPSLTLPFLTLLLTFTRTLASQLVALTMLPGIHFSWVPSQLFIASQCRVLNITSSSCVLLPVCTQYCEFLSTNHVYYLNLLYKLAIFIHQRCPTLRLNMLVQLFRHS